MLSKDKIISLITTELENCDSDNTQGNLETSLSYYLGRPNGTEVEGRSSVTSTDVADAIEWIMPQIMKAFTQNNEIVIFDPVHEGDEKQAELESQYVYEVLMKQNDGFIILHQFIKDALMQRNGLLKVYYAKFHDVRVSSYTGITEEQLQALLQAEGVDILEKTKYVDQNATVAKRQQIQQQLQVMMQQAQSMMQQASPSGNQMTQQFQQQVRSLEQEMEVPVTLFNVKISATRIRGKIYIDPVPPEEFRVNSNHNSICLDKARFTAHVTTKTATELMVEYDLSFDDAKELPESSTEYDREYRFAMQEESVFYNSSSDDPALRDIQVSECYMLMDIDESGIAKLVKVTVAGDGGSITDLIKVEEIDSMPWVSTTTFLMSHKFQGLSITDRLSQIQDQKTALWRNMLDNMYLQNNQRNVVVENQVNLDDLLVSRPGGIIRAKRLDAIMPLVTPQLGQDAYNMMEYLDRVRSGRTGVDPEGQATPQSIGDRVGSQGVERLMNAKEELVGLIIRVIAETGIKPLCIKVRDLTLMHVDSVIDFRFRGQWQKLTPSQWPDRTQTTVRVGTGTGNHAAQLMALSQVMAIQEKILSNPAQTILGEKQIYTALDDFCKFSGLNGAVRYFIDPDSEQGKERAKQVSESSQANQQKEAQMQQAMAKAQMDLGTAALQEAEAKQATVKARMEADRAKAQADQYKMQIDFIKAQSEAQIKQLQQQLAEAKAISDAEGKDAQLQFQYDQLRNNTAIQLTQLEVDSLKEQSENFESNLGSQQ